MYISQGWIIVVFIVFIMFCISVGAAVDYAQRLSVKEKALYNRQKDLEQKEKELIERYEATKGID